MIQSSSNVHLQRSVVLASAAEGVESSSTGPDPVGVLAQDLGAAVEVELAEAAHVRRQDDVGQGVERGRRGEGLGRRDAASERKRVSAALLDGELCRAERGGRTRG